MVKLPSKKILFFLSGVTIFLLFVGFSFLVHKNQFSAVDFDFTVRLQNHIPHRFDVPFSLLSLVGSVEIAGAFLLIFMALRRKLSGLFILFIFGFFHVFELYGKAFVTHPGPPFFMLRYNLGFVFPSAYVRPGSSYPSGHAARALFITTILAMFFAKKKKLSVIQKSVIFSALTIYDVAMCVSRVYLGEHWTSDVIGGVFLGFAFGLIGAAAL